MKQHINNRKKMFTTRLEYIHNGFNGTAGRKQPGKRSTQVQRFMMAQDLLIQHQVESSRAQNSQS